MATAKSTENSTVERSSRKRPYHQSSDAENESVLKNEKKNAEPKATSKKRKRQKKESKQTDTPKKKTKKPLAGMTVSVSTLSDNTKKDSAQNDSSSYNDVCSLCRSLGANVIDLVCKRVSLLVCSEAAIKQATQRVRKAIKRNKPLVSVEWLEKCQQEGYRVETKEYRLDDQAKEAIKNREERLQSAAEAAKENNDEDLEAIPDSGWTEPQDLGCCCVCHENGTTADCPWCVDCPANPNRLSAKK